jgi:hypothetical protein
MLSSFTNAKLVILYSFGQGNDIILQMERSTWVRSVLEHLSCAGEVGRATAEFITSRNVPIGFLKQSPHTGAMWFINGGIYLNPRRFGPETPPDHPRVLSLIVHEARHLQQGFFTALSVYGELDAWQLDFNFQKSLTGEYPNAAIAELCTLPLSFDRDVLKRAARLMQAHAGKAYRVNWLPLFPLSREIKYWLNK